MKRLVCVVIVLLMLFQIIILNVNAVTPSTISGSISGETYYLKNVASQKYLAVNGNGDTNGDNVWSYGPNFLSSQKWIVTQNSDQTFTITSATSSNKVLTINNNSKNAELYDNSYASNQKFVITRIISGDCKGCYKISIADEYLYDNAYYNSNVFLSDIDSIENTSWSFQKVNGGYSSLCGFYYQAKLS